MMQFVYVPKSAYTNMAYTNSCCLYTCNDKTRICTKKRVYKQCLCVSTRVKVARIHARQMCVYVHFYISTKCSRT